VLYLRNIYFSYEKPIGLESLDELGKMTDKIVTSIKLNFEDKVISLRTIDGQIFHENRERQSIELVSYVPYVIVSEQKQKEVKRIPFVTTKPQANGFGFVVRDMQGKEITIYYQDHNLWRKDYFFTTKLYADSAKVFVNLPLFF
jgi:hypothetical protein